MDAISLANLIAAGGATFTALGVLVAAGVWIRASRKSARHEGKTQGMIIAKLDAWETSRKENMTELKGLIGGLDKGLGKAHRIATVNGQRISRIEGRLGIEGELPSPNIGD